MTAGLLSIAAPETSLALAAQAEVAQSFGLPSWGLAGTTDAKVLDAQAGSESAFSILAQALSGPTSSTTWGIWITVWSVPPPN